MLFWFFKAVYNTSKFAFIFLTLTLAFELAGKEYGLFLSGLEFLLFSTFALLRAVIPSTSVRGVVGAVEAILTLSVVTGGPRLFDFVQPYLFLLISPWQLFLQLALPISVLLEGLASVIVFCEIGKVVNHTVQVREGTQPLFLGGAVGISALTCFGIYAILGSAVSSTYGFFMGCSVTCAVALCAFAMYSEKNSIVDSVLLIAYITFNFWMISNPLNETPIHIEQPGLDWSYLNVLSLDWQAVILYLSKIFSNLLGFLWSISDQFIISLFYRFGVIYAGIRIVTLLRLSEETDPFESNVSFIGVLRLLVKPLFVAMYTYSLMIHHGHFTAYSQFFQWLNILWSIGVYVDATFLAYEDSPSLVDHWKTE
ncbi:hypothetical protein K493DRAFT_319859 [Basidiobolus meristosporus CBS 931.73]|uniref:ICE2-domain-containing protein n=1 Tax=Basidiobolus meristosporus CBS 931.73 TaxID=1314790 RepID=A0A1Y1XK52_9FUNG|nr:hypothetical protein K493DRAFT_319859 [Basidiobolus meristosporus CBS 931.73]|eukprot:ORX86092.1 hypothetical protein K493DRAFT_319859 [Basidiobolus meristosporus CBS 931.73]